MVSAPVLVDTLEWVKRLEAAYEGFFLWHDRDIKRNNGAVAGLLSSPWRRAEFDPNDSLVYLVVDGVYSASLPSHWAEHLANVLHELPGEVRAFSYAEYGRHYTPDHTTHSVESLQARWVTYLSKLQKHQRVIPICFSLGSIVALLGTLKWFELTRGNLDPAKVIPAIVLVAPAHSVSPLLRLAYEQAAREPESLVCRTKPRLMGSILDLPPIIHDLCLIDSPFRLAAVESLTQIPGMGIDLHVIFWPGDVFTPHWLKSDCSRTEGLPTIFDHLVLLNESSRGVRYAVKEHMRIRTHPDTDRCLIQILRAY